MNKKGFTSVILIILIIVLVGAVGYFVLVKKSPKIIQQIPDRTITPASTPISTSTPTLPISSIEYRNDQYGFRFFLPASWKGYSIMTDKWEGYTPDPYVIVEQGPLISIRHPQWTSQNPRQDIPIMVFSVSQWNSLQQDKFHIGAAPINPSELGRNSRYVFALPARYNYAFPTGYEEVEKILQEKPLQTF